MRWRLERTTRCRQIGHYTRARPMNTMNIIYIEVSLCVFCAWGSVTRQPVPTLLEYQLRRKTSVTVSCRASRYCHNNMPDDRNGGVSKCSFLSCNHEEVLFA
jgi:hypothetical protein